MGFTDEQLRELVAVFRAEAMEHVKTLAGVFLSLEQAEPSAVPRVLGGAFRAAHSLKGSAGTLGFIRVEELTHRLEDALGVLKRRERAVSAAEADVLLGALDVVRAAVESSEPGDDELTAEERERMDELDGLATPGGKGAASAPPAAQSADADRRLVRTSEIPPDDLVKLSAVFRAEAIEHVKALAEVFFLLEEGSGEAREHLTRAFREAHSLKGSAGTLGFERIETVTHALEDVLGMLTRNGADTVEHAATDLLLTALDAIRRGVETTRPGDDALTEEERRLVEALGRLTAESGGPAPGSPPGAETKARLAAEAADKTGPRVDAGKPEAARQEARPPGEFIRIAESNIETVIAQVGELFETNLQLGAIGGELDGFGEMIQEVIDGLDAFQAEFTGTGYGAALFPTAEKARSLGIQLKAAAKRFEQEERQISKLVNSTQESLRKIRLAPVSTVFIAVRRQVREVTKATGKKVDLFLDGGEYAVDRKVLDAVEEPLVHIIRNAVDHGIEEPAARVGAGKPESGRLSITARHTGDAVELTVADDGRGIDPESVRQALIDKNRVSREEAAKLSEEQLVDYLFESGVTTQRGVSKISGRGVGLDVVKYTVERLGGEVRLTTRVGEGTAISLRLPLAMSTVRCLLVRVASKIMAIPAANVEKVVLQKAENIKVLGGAEVIGYMNQHVPLGSLAEILGLATGGAAGEGRMAVIIRFGERRFAFRIDDLVEYAQLILKPLGDLLERVPNVSGISLLSTGDIALVLNPADLVRSAGSVRRKETAPIFTAASGAKDVIRILVVDDSIATRTLEKTLLESAGFTVVTASDGYKALDVLDTMRCDLVISDVQMPNMDGFELTRSIKSRPQLSRVPVVLVSALGADEDKGRGLAAGADAYIVKQQLTQDELVATINQLL